MTMSRLSAASRATTRVFHGSWGSACKASLHPRAGSPAEHLGWGARLYAAAALRGLRPIEPMTNLIRASFSLSCVGRDYLESQLALRQSATN